MGFVIFSVVIIAAVIIGIYVGKKSISKIAWQKYYSHEICAELFYGSRILNKIIIKLHEQ